MNVCVNIYVDLCLVYFDYVFGQRYLPLPANMHIL